MFTKRNIPDNTWTSFSSNHMNARTPTVDATRNSLASATLSLPSPKNDFWKETKEPT